MSASTEKQPRSGYNQIPIDKIQEYKESWETFDRFFDETRTLIQKQPTSETSTDDTNTIQESHVNTGVFNIDNYTQYSYENPLTTKAMLTTTPLPDINSPDHVKRFREKLEDFMILLWAFTKETSNIPESNEKLEYLHGIMNEIPGTLTQEKKLYTVLYDKHINLFFSLCQVYKWVEHISNNPKIQNAQKKITTDQTYVKFMETFRQVMNNTKIDSGPQPRNKKTLREYYNDDYFSNLYMYRIDESNLKSIKQKLAIRIYNLGICILKEILSESYNPKNPDDSSDLRECSTFLSDIATLVKFEDDTQMKTPYFYIMEYAQSYLRGMPGVFNDFSDILTPFQNIPTPKVGVLYLRIFVYVYHLLQNQKTVLLVIVTSILFFVRYEGKDAILKLVKETLLLKTSNIPPVDDLKTRQRQIVNDIIDQYTSFMQVIETFHNKNSFTPVNNALFNLNIDDVVKTVEPYIIKIHRFVEISKHFKDLIAKRSSGDVGKIEILKQELRTKEILPKLVELQTIADCTYDVNVLNKTVRFFNAFVDFWNKNEFTPPTPLAESVCNDSNPNFDVEALAQLQDVVTKLESIHAINDRLYGFINKGDNGTADALAKQMLRFISTYDDSEKSIAKMLADDDLYIHLVKVYEDLSKAVRVIIKVRDDHLLKGGYTEEIAKKEDEIIAHGFPHQRGTDLNNSSKLDNLEWYFMKNKLMLTDQYVHISEDSDATNNKLEKSYGAFFKVVPPYYYEPNFTSGQESPLLRMNNDIIAERYVKVDGLASLLCSPKKLNLVMMTYGYSGSGKTYTLFGSLATAQENTNPQNGIVTNLIGKVYDKGYKMQLHRIHTLYGKLKERTHKNSSIEVVPPIPTTNRKRPHSSNAAVSTTTTHNTPESYFLLDDDHNPKAFQHEVDIVNKTNVEKKAFQASIKSAMQRIVDRNNIQYIFDVVTFNISSILAQSETTNEKKYTAIIESLLHINFQSENKFMNYNLSGFIGYLLKQDNDMLEQLTPTLVYEYMYQYRFDMYELSDHIAVFIAKITRLQQLVQQNDNDKTEYNDLYNDIKTELASLHMYTEKFGKASSFIQYFEDNAQMYIVKKDTFTDDSNNFITLLNSMKSYVTEISTTYPIYNIESSTGKEKEHCIAVYELCVANYIRSNDTYHKNIQLFKYRDPINNQLIKSTPNNIHSSRGFLIFEFLIGTHDATNEFDKKTNNKLVIIDMAGNEDPYDIIMKTMPTIAPPTDRLQLKNICQYGEKFDYYLSDTVVRDVADKLGKSLSDIITPVATVVSYCVSAAATNNIEQIVLYALGGKSNKGEINKGDYSYVIALSEVLQNDMGKTQATYNYFFSDRKELCKNILDLQLFENEWKRLRKSYYTLIIDLLGYAIEYFKDNKKFSNIKISRNLNELDTFFILFEKTFTYKNPHKTYSDIKKELKKSFNVHTFFEYLNTIFEEDLNSKLNVEAYPLFNVNKDNVNKDNNTVEIALSKKVYLLLSLYYLSNNDFKNIDDEIIICGIKDITALDSAGKQKVYSLYKKLQIKIDSLSSMITNVSQEQSIKKKLQEQIQEYSKLRYIMQILLVYDDTHGFNDVQLEQKKLFDLIKNFATLQKNKLIHLIDFGSASKQSVEDLQKIIGHNIGLISKDLFSDVIMLDEKTLQGLEETNAIGNADATENVVVTEKAKKTDKDNASDKTKDICQAYAKDKSDTTVYTHKTISSHMDYYKTIVMEGFYINQVNYELMKFLAKAKDISTRSNDNSVDNEYNKNAKKTQVNNIPSNERLLFGKYNPRESINPYINTLTSFPNLMTKIRNVLDDILLREIDVQGQKTKVGFDDTKWFMIANIRPDLERYRQGAINTLDLINELRST